MATCSVTDCGRRSVAKGYCNKHYNRWRRHGDPTVTAQVLTRHMTVAERLEASTSHESHPQGCWLFTGALHWTGYGQLLADGRQKGAHVVSYELANGPVPDGLQVLHSCDNRPCVNPDHLRAGTHQENMDDKVARGRQYRPPRKVTV